MHDVTTIPAESGPPAEDRSTWPRAGHDGMAIASLCTSFFVPVLGIIFGGVSISAAHREHMRASGLAIAGLVIGIIGSVVWTLYWLIIIIAAISAASAPAYGG